MRADPLRPDAPRGQQAQRMFAIVTSPIIEENVP
jgi:hypothetical protein